MGRIDSEALSDKVDVSIFYIFAGQMAWIGKCLVAVKISNQYKQLVATYLLGLSTRWHIICFNYNVNGNFSGRWVRRI